MIKIKEKWVERLFRGALIMGLLHAGGSYATIKSWIEEKLPYKLPPEKLQFDKLKAVSATEVTDKNGEILFYLSTPKLHLYRPLTEISSDLAEFVVLSEDAKFFAHEGFDIEEIENSLKKNIAKGKVKRGGSTLTQQLAKNLFLDKQRTVTRKLFEIPWTMQLERDLTKKQILELYLNTIEWGPGIYGAEAASRHFFDKHAIDLDALEALYLTMIVPNPPRFDLYAHPKMKDFLEAKKKAFTVRIYGEKKIDDAKKTLMLQEGYPLASLSQETRRFPLQHASTYTGSPNEFEKRWGKLDRYLKAKFKNPPPSIRLSIEKSVPLTADEIDSLISQNKVLYVEESSSSSSSE